jgi:hypothetical protein
MSRFHFRTLCAPLCVLALPAATSGCATLSDSTQQQLEVHTILDKREVAGVGCVLSNNAGRWFVVAPGRVTVERSSGPLAIDCARQGSGSAREQVVSRFDTDKLLGNALTSAGLGYYVDRRSGAGFSYPSTLTVIMRGPQAAGQDGQPVTADNVIF